MQFWTCLFLITLAVFNGCRFLDQVNISDASPCLVSFGNVGQGDATIIIAPCGRTLLVDTGPDSLRLLKFLDKMPIDTLHVLLISHAHKDHIGAVAAVFKHFTVQRLVYSADKNLGDYQIVLNDLLQEFPVDTSTLFFGDSLMLGDVNLSVLWPRRFSTYSENNLSTVLKLRYGYSSVLLTGDIHEETELEVQYLYNHLDSDILKVPHHGSSTSSCLPFLAAVSPEWAVISCDSSVYGHPDAETLNDLRVVGVSSGKILRTDVMGDVQFKIFPGWVELIP